MMDISPETKLQGITTYQRETDKTLINMSTSLVQKQSIIDLVQIDKDEGFSLSRIGWDNCDITSKLSCRGVESIGHLKGLMTNDKNVNVSTHYIIVWAMGMLVGRYSYWIFCMLFDGTIRPEYYAVK